jgi:hypothetical protein
VQEVEKFLEELRDKESRIAYKLLWWSTYKYWVIR